VKFDRFEWCLEKATELGVSEVIPVAAARTDKPLVAAAEKRQERWRRILLESAQQARRLDPPILCDAISPEKAFEGCTAESKIILSERSDAPKMRAVLASYGNAKTAALAIGPEGGWTDGEIAAACAADFAEASLGGNILRTETAVIASLAILRFPPED
jgi:16S rRNA (uracil1498-N3)-methyltransferase